MFKEYETEVIRHGSWILITYPGFHADGRIYWRVELKLGGCLVFDSISYATRIESKAAAYERLAEYIQTGIELSRKMPRS